MKYTTILFDLDGTLLYTLEDLADSINHTLTEYNQPTLTLEQVRNYVGNGLRKLAERALPEGNDYDKFEEFFKDFVSYYNTHNLIKTKPYDGIMETTKRLNEANIKMAIVTNKGQTASDSLIKDFFAPNITVVIGDNGIHKRKPDPEPINIALEELGVTDKSSVLYVGDSEVDGQTAENSGIDYVLCTYGFRDMDVLSQFKPVAFIDNISKLIDIVLD